jgi:hypothetical protein
MKLWVVSLLLIPALAEHPHSSSAGRAVCGMWCLIRVRRPEAISLLRDSEKDWEQRPRCVEEAAGGHPVTRSGEDTLSHHHGSREGHPASPASLPWVLKCGEETGPSEAQSSTEWEKMVSTGPRFQAVPGGPCWGV